MKIPVWSRTFLISLFLANGAALVATCGGGGGGGAGGAGMGGMGGMSPNQPEVYQAPWRLFEHTTKLVSLPDTSLIVLWFQAGVPQVKSSDLRTSRVLALAAARGVADFLVPPDDVPAHSAFQMPVGHDTVLVVEPTGREIGRVAADAKGRLDTGAVEKLLAREIDTREKDLKALADAAEKRLKAGDKTATDDLQKVWAQHIMFPSLGKRAAKALG